MTSRSRGRRSKSPAIKSRAPLLAAAEQHLPSCTSEPRNGVQALMTTVGWAMGIVSLATVQVQCFPWQLPQYTCKWLGMAGSLPSGARNPTAVVVSMAKWLGGALNAVALGWFYLASKPIACGYVAWFVSVALLQAAQEVAKYRAGSRWQSEASSMRARLFQAFNVRVQRLDALPSGPRTPVYCSISKPLYLLVGMMPALLVAIVVSWFWEVRQELDCSTVNDTSSLQCDGLVVSRNCCQVVDKRFDNWFVFTGFLVGNFTACYEFVRIGALCLLAYAHEEGVLACTDVEQLLSEYDHAYVRADSLRTLTNDSESPTHKDGGKWVQRRQSTRSR